MAQALYEQPTAGVNARPVGNMSNAEPASPRILAVLFRQLELRHGLAGGRVAFDFALRFGLSGEIWLGLLRASR
jgi:hypothetical protein